MTIAAGFEFDGGIMLCADTKITADIKTNESKLLWMIHKEKCVTVFAISATDFDLAKAAARQCEEAIGQIHFENIDISGIRKSIESSLVKFYKTNIFPNPDFRAQMEFLVGVWFRGETRLYVSKETVLNAVNGYECIGDGASLSKYLIKQALEKPRYVGQYRPTLEEVGLVAGFALESTVQHIESTGGEIEYISLSDKAEQTIGWDGPPAYPSQSLPSVLQKLMWETLRGLLHIEGRDEAECEKVIDEYCEKIHAANKADRWLIDMKLPSTDKQKKE
jgi:hypothetical protein